MLQAQSIILCRVDMEAEGERCRPCIWRVERSKHTPLAPSPDLLKRQGYTTVKSFLHNKLPPTASNGYLRYSGKAIHVGDPSDF